MRTTLRLDGEALEKARAYAGARGLTLGEAVSDLVLKATGVDVPMVQKNGLWVFDPPRCGSKATARQVRSLIDAGT